MKEPLLHFLAGGGLLFVLFYWQRSPNAEERRALIEDGIREEILHPVR